MLCNDDEPTTNPGSWLQELTFRKSANKFLASGLDDDETSLTTLFVYEDMNFVVRAYLTSLATLDVIGVSVCGRLSEEENRADL